MGRLTRFRHAVKNRAGRLARAIALRAPIVVRDMIGLAGAGLVSYGVWLIYEPYGFIVAGSMLLIGAFLTAKAS